jgi:hypothetical protein
MVMLADSNPAFIWNYESEKSDLCGRTKKILFFDIISSNLQTKSNPDHRVNNMATFIIQQTWEHENSAELQQVGGRAGGSDQ